MLLYRTDQGLVLVTEGRSLRLTDLTFDAPAAGSGASRRG